MTRGSGRDSRPIRRTAGGPGAAPGTPRRRRRGRHPAATPGSATAGSARVSGSSRTTPVWTKRPGQQARLALAAGRADERADLARGLAPPAPDGFPAGEVAGVDLADPVLREAGAEPDGPGAGLVLDHPDGQVETLPLAGVAVICCPHVSPDYDQFWSFWNKSCHSFCLFDPFGAFIVPAGRPRGSSQMPSKWPDTQFRREIRDFNREFLELICTDTRPGTAFGLPPACGSGSGCWPRPSWRPSPKRPACWRPSPCCRPASWPGASPRARGRPACR